MAGSDPRLPGDAPPAHDAREAVLARIRAALADRPVAVVIPREYDRTLPLGTDIADLFVDKKTNPPSAG